MARKKGYLKRFPISEDSVIGALTDATFLGQNYDDSFSRDHFVVTQKATYTLNGHTPGEGPLHVILAHGDYSDAEVLEWWLATNAWETSDKVAQEFRRRKCRHVGSFPGISAEEVLNNGMPIKTPLKFVVEAGETLQFGIVNNSGATLTTGTLIQTQGNIWAKPL